MSENIYDLANNLERALRQLPEYLAVVEAKSKIDQNEEAKALFTEYASFQGELQQALQTGQVPDQAMQEKMETLSKKIQDNPILAEYFAKQQQLSIYLSDIERIIFSPLKDLVK